MSKASGNEGGSPRAAGTRRRVVVFVSLVCVLTLTSALLLALAPAPLNPQASSSLLAIDGPESRDALFDSAALPVQTGRWQFIYIHHSQSPSGSAQTLAESSAGLLDHFVIGNGDGCSDGEIQIGQRWAQQLAPGRPPGREWIRPDCISICLIGDFNQTRPTPTQLHRLMQLVGALQTRLHIFADHVWLDPRASGAAGIGALFPARQFQADLVP